MARQPLTVTLITDTHYYSKSIGTEGAAYDKANAKSQKLLKNCATRAKSRRTRKLSNSFVG